MNIKRNFGFKEVWVLTRRVIYSDCICEHPHVRELLCRDIGNLLTPPALLF